MTIPGIIAFIVLALLGSLAILWSQSLYQKHRQRFVFAYTLHLGFWNALALVQVTQYILGGQILNRGAWVSMTVTLWPLNTLILGVSLIFFIAATLAICERPLARSWRFLFMAAWLLVIVLGMNWSVSLTKRIPDVPNMIVFTLKHGTVIAFVTALQVWAAREDPIKRAFIRRFSAVYLAGYLFFQLSIADIIPVYTTPFPDHLIAAIQICFHFPVLAVMNRYLELRARNRTPEVERTGFADLLAGLGLSAREAEIVGLVSQGYSNKEIEDELFISLATVKKHLFNVFKKLKVKNRVQLTNFIQNATTGSTVGHEKKNAPAATRRSS